MFNYVLDPARAPILATQHADMTNGKCIAPFFKILKILNTNFQQTNSARKVVLPTQCVALTKTKYL
jgi:hypothetical protein